MPNIPNSAAQIPAKKRKLSSTSSASSRNLDPPSQLTRNHQADVGSGDHVNNVQDTVDEAILNSEIYKIYCRNEDPKEAIKQIQELKTCIFFEQSTQLALAEDDLKRESEKTLNNLWNVEPELGDSKFIKIKKYIGYDINQYGLDDYENNQYDSDDYENDQYGLDDLNKTMWHAINFRFTKIKMLIPNGYECWYVAKIEHGPMVAKWYRAESTDSFGVCLLAQLNVMGITEATIQKFQYNHYLKDKIEKTPWFDFASSVLRGNLSFLFPNYRQPRHAFDIEEAKTDTEIVTNASLRLTQLINSDNRDEQCLSRKTVKTYNGESTRPLKKIRNSVKEKEEMTKEAKKAAMMELFEEHFGFTEFKDLYVDELQRSIGN